jgi:hypothetical protein
MDSAFSITTTTNAISLDAAGRSAAVFTVNNQTGRSVRVRTEVAVFPPTPSGWFSVDGAIERLYPPGGAEAVTVLVDAGAAAPVGRYAFRLDALSVDRPDEEWGHGPSVGFEVAEPPPPPPPPQPKVRRGYLETVLGALAGAALMMIVTVIVSAIVSATAFNAIPGVAAIILRLQLVTGLTAGCALAAGVGAVVALGVRGIEDSAPWRTGLPLGILAGAILTVFQVVLALAFLIQPANAGNIALIVIGTLLLIVPAALAGRAYARLRAGGTL